MASPREPEAHDPPALRRRTSVAGIRHQQRPDDRQHRDAQDVALHRDRGPDAGHQPPARVARLDHACQAPANAIALDSAMRFGFQMNVDSSTAEVETAIASAGDQARDRPPIERASHHVTRTAAIPANAMSAVTASGESPPVRKAAGESR